MRVIFSLICVWAKENPGKDELAVSSALGLNVCSHFIFSLLHFHFHLVLGTGP